MINTLSLVYLKKFFLQAPKKVITLIVFGWALSCSQTMEQYAQGEALFQSAGCAVCHSLAGGEMYGPPLNSILNKKVIVFRNGKEEILTVDRAYIKKSIENPDYEKIKGYESRKMPLPTLDEKEIEALTEYLIFINTTISK